MRRGPQLGKPDLGPWNLKMGGTGIGVLLLAREARGKAIEWNWAKRIKLYQAHVCASPAAPYDSLLEP